MKEKHFREHEEIFFLIEVLKYSNKRIYFNCHNKTKQ
jgi:hypothetical protein